MPQGIDNLHSGICAVGSSSSIYTLVADASPSRQTDKVCDNGISPTGTPERGCGKENMDKKEAGKKAKRILLFILREQEKSGLSIREFSSRAGLARTCLYNWTVGKYMPNMLTVIMALDQAGYEFAIRRKADDAERNG